MRHIILIAITLFSIVYSQNPPKHEFRAAWVATVYRLDWPRSNWSSSAMQNEITQMADSLKHNGFNAIIFQVRPECDAFYASSYEPWSRHLTGTSGQAPSPYFDPLEMWIEAAHSRGMELHAWFNPYRVTTSSNPSTLHPSHVYHQHPEWLLSVGTRQDDISPEMTSNTLETERDLRSSLILDPGLSAVRDYVVGVFLDVVNNYDVDAVHMDDYFYPYGGMNGEDAATFAAEPRGFGNIDNWRRDNINLLVAAIHDSIQVVKPWVKYGVSPFGIWKSGYPSGIVGTSSYYELYCDPMAWLGAGTIDYLTPQLYWEHGGGQDYGSLMPWWADSVSAHNRHLYVGHAPYRMSDFHNWPVTELTRQVRLNRNTEGCQGSVYFRLRSGIVDNPKHFQDSLRLDLYRYPALKPPMPWIDDEVPNSPQSPSIDGNMLSWIPPEAAADGDTAYQYVIYSSLENTIDESDPANIYRIVQAPTSSIPLNPDANVHGISALDRIGNESELVYFNPADISKIQLPEEIHLLRAYPNPFNPTVQLEMNLGKSAHVNLVIRDIQGRVVKEVISAEMNRGSHTISWGADDEQGNPVDAGVYVATLFSMERSISTKLVYLK